MQTFKVKVKPNASKNKLVYDKEKELYVVSVKAPPDKGKANKELMKFLSKELKKKVRIRSGLRSREKVMEVL